jgi:class 3 adenylate cyclase
MIPLEQREVLGRLLATQQQVIDLKAQIDREHLAGEGFRRFGERAFEVDSLEAFFAIAAEEVVATFGTENALVLRIGPEGPTVCATCCADDATVSEVRAFTGYFLDVSGIRARVITDTHLPPLRGRATAVLLTGTYFDSSDSTSTYAVLATVSQSKAAFYPAFTGELAPLYEAFLHHVGALQQHLRNRAATLNLVRATQHFVPQEFLHALGHADVTTARLGDAVLRKITILFADIRNFTSISERMSPAETAAFLNSCLSRMGPHIRAHGGFVDKYIGDAIMALFPGSPSDAVQAALAMQLEVAQTRVGASLRSGFGQTQRLQTVVIGVGIHTGDVMLCTVGEQERCEAPVISDAVNLTARLETLTKQLGCTMLVSAEVVAQLDSATRLHMRELGLFAVKGKSQSCRVFEIFATDPDELRVRKLESREPFARALGHYGRAEFSEALAIMQELADRCPEDGPVAWWLAHICHDIANSAAVGHMGVVQLNSK